jgi:hypothetical protein
MSPSRHSEEAIEKVDELAKLPTIEDSSNESTKDVGISRDSEHKTVEKDEPIQRIEHTIDSTEGTGAEGEVKPPASMADLASIPPSAGLGAQDSLKKGDSLADPEVPTGSAPSSLDPMESSTATLKPNRPRTPTKEEVYLDPTPKTPMRSLPVSRSASSDASAPNHAVLSNRPERSPTRSEGGFDDKPSNSEDEREGNSRSEIQSIMDQFSEEGGGPGVEEVMSPRLEFAGPLLGSPIQHPPRKSSLEPLNAHMVDDLRVSTSSPQSHQTRTATDKGPAVPPKPSSVHAFSPSRVSDERASSKEASLAATAPSLHRPPPPEPEPEPDLPFDFHRFLEQLRHRTADPVAKFLRSFLQEFGKKQWMVHEQVKIIGDFLAFITNKMAQCEVWREVSDAEFDNAREGMEKLVMNRLYTQTFSPAIPPPQPIPGSRSKRKSVERPMGPGRRGQHQEDVERDDILAQKVSIYGWVKEEHLDIEPVGDSGKRFLVLAQQG